MPNSSQGPLAGVRAIELGQIAAGPFTGSLLADLGADVVKIERPDGGDGMRGWPPLSTAGDAGAPYSENFASLNRNKRSVALDLKDRSGIDRLLRLADAADVLVENYRPGVLARLGADYAVVGARNPGIVYCSISGYGQTGPYANKGAFDVTVQGMSGLMSVTGEPGGGPVKCGVPVGDFCAGLYAAYTITASLMRARETGRGAYIDCSMLGSLVGVAALQTSEYFGTGRAPVCSAPRTLATRPTRRFLQATSTSSSRRETTGCSRRCAQRWGCRISPGIRASPRSFCEPSIRASWSRSSRRDSRNVPPPNGSRRWMPEGCLALRSAITREC